MTHQQLSTIVDHADHFPRVLIKSPSIFHEIFGEADDSIDWSDQIVANGSLMLLHNASPFVLNIQFFLGRYIFEADHIISALAACEFDLLAAHFVYNLLRQILFSDLTLKLNQLVHLEHQ